MTQNQCTSPELVVVKVGTSTLTNTDDGRHELFPEAFETIAEDVAYLRSEHDKAIILVTSGAIAAGMAQKDITERPPKNEKVSELQALASVGMVPLFSLWAEKLRPSTIGPLLLTRNELSTDTPERTEALETVHSLIQNGDIPIVNENDAITHEEIDFGDNDILAAHLTKQIKLSPLFGDYAIRLVVLSDVFGVYEDQEDPSTTIPLIEDLEDFIDLAGSPGSTNGSGGMKSKFAAARIVTKQGIEMHIANGRIPSPISKTINGKIGTKFSAE